jgi:uncharacterized alkaline shock family protein YloU
VADAVIRDSADRGTLRIRDAAVEHLVRRAVLDVDGVVAHRSGLDALTGRDLPRIDTSLSDDRVRVALDVGVEWPHGVATAAGGVRSAVTDVLHRYAGLDVAACDVTVVPVQPQESERTVR